MHCLKSKVVVSICGFCVLLLLVDLHLYLFAHFLVFIIITMSTSLYIYAPNNNFLSQQQRQRKQLYALYFYTLYFKLLLPNNNLFPLSSRATIQI